MFSKLDKYRNLSGLELNATFEETNRIIGEFDYLNELIGKRVGVNDNVIYVRVRYNEQYWYEDTAKELCRKKYHQLQPNLPIKSELYCEVQ